MRGPSLTIAIGLSLALGACGTGNRSVESVHQPVVSRSDYVLDVNAAGGGLSGSDQSRIAGWFDSLNLGYGDRISVDMGDAYSPATRDAVAEIAARYGLLLDANAPVTNGAIAPGNARVIISRMKAEVPSCPDWSRSMSEDFNNHAMSNYGCAVNTNLAAMVASPGDLVSGREGNVSVDASTVGKAIKSYRTQKPTGEQGLEKQSTRESK